MKSGTKIHLRNHDQYFTIVIDCSQIQNKGGGVVAIYVKENIYCEEKVELKQNGLESIWVKIHTKRVDILFGLFY